MKTNITSTLTHARTKHRQLAKDQRGTTMVEYVFLLVVIMVFCVGAYKTLASKISTSATAAAAAID